jgi:hypothetical protein
MSKVISEKVQESNPAEVIKQVEIKHTRTMKDASGSDVVVVDHVEVKNVDDAISQSEKDKARLEAQLAEVTAELADYIAIRDAE